MYPKGNGKAEARKCRLTYFVCHCELFNESKMKLWKAKRSSERGRGKISDYCKEWVLEGLYVGNPLAAPLWGLWLVDCQWPCLCAVIASANHWGRPRAHCSNRWVVFTSRRRSCRRTYWLVLEALGKSRLPVSSAMCVCVRASLPARPSGWTWHQA